MNVGSSVVYWLAESERAAAEKIFGDQKWKILVGFLAPNDLVGLKVGHLGMYLT